MLIPVRPDVAACVAVRQLEGPVKPVFDVVVLVQVLPVLQLTPEVHQLLSAVDKLLL